MMKFIGAMRALAARVGRGRVPGRVVGGGNTSAARELRSQWPLFEQIFGWLPARRREKVKPVELGAQKHGRHNKIVALSGARGPARRARKLDVDAVARAILKAKADEEQGPPDAAA